MADAEPIPLSALQHATSCMRQAALIHLERLWADNRFTAEGDVLHAVADNGGKRQARGLRRVMALAVFSTRLGIAGICDMVEFVADVPSRWNTSAANPNCIAPTRCSFARKPCV